MKCADDPATVTSDGVALWGNSLSFAVRELGFNFEFCAHTENKTSLCEQGGFFMRLGLPCSD
jgi:hypothetical protein